MCGSEPPTASHLMRETQRAPDPGLCYRFAMAAWLAAPIMLLALAAGGMALLKRHYRTPQIPHRRTPAALGLPFEEIRFPTAGGRSLYGWWIPAPETRTGATLVLVHGWSRNVGRMLPFIGPLHAAGHDLLAFDARSHGSSDSDGTPTMLKFSADIVAALDEAVRRDADPGRLGVLGLSVGGAAAIHAAAHDGRLGAVTTVGAFADPGELMAAELRARRVPGILVSALLRYVEHEVGARLTEIAPQRQIQHVDAPVLLVHGDGDVTVPVEHGHRLAAAGGGNVRLLVLPGRGHSDCNHDAAFWPAVLELFSRV